MLWRLKITGRTVQGNKTTHELLDSLSDYPWPLLMEWLTQLRSQTWGHKKSKEIGAGEIVHELQISIKPHLEEVSWPDSPTQQATLFQQTTDSLVSTPTSGKSSQSETVSPKTGRTPRQSRSSRKARRTPSSSRSEEAA